MDWAGFIGWILLSFLLLLVGWDCRRTPARLILARNVFLLSMAAWYGMEAAACPAMLQQYSLPEYRAAVGCIVLCVAGFLVGYSMNGGCTPWSQRQRHQPAGNVMTSDQRAGSSVGWLQLPVFFGQPDRLWFLFLVLVGVGITPLLVIARGDVLGILEDAFVPKKRWSSIFQRARYGDVRDAFLELQMFLWAAVPVAASIVFLSRQTVLRRLLATFLLAYMVARSLNDGARVRVVEAGLPILGAVYWRVGARGRRWLLLTGLPCLCVIGFLWSAATVVGRDQGRLDWRMAFQSNYTGFEMFRELLFIRRMVPEHYPYLLGHSYYVQAINPVPRFLWQGKPKTDSGLQLARMQGAVVNGEPKLTIAPGLLGEAYWNFSTAGVVAVGFIFGVFSRRWDSLLTVVDHCPALFPVFASGLAAIFLCGRSVNLSNFYGLLSLVVVAWVLHWWTANSDGDALAATGNS